MLTPGARIGPFEVEAPLGAGGMGEVYRARDGRLGREVAIKVLPAERLADEGRRRRFVQEARAASALNHPHIVTIHEIGSADGIDFIVMEYLAGQALDRLIPKSGMPVHQALRFAIPIADAVAAAHAKGIVHRDLKPANVIVTSEGVVKVLDFGLAKLVADETPEDGSRSVTTLGVSGALSQPGAIAGTAPYMSPEQATGGKVDSRSDVFSFGAMLYEIVTGRRAFAGKTASDTLTAVVSTQPQAPRELVPGLPEALERLILRCLRKEVDRRYQHMADVRLELEEIAEGGQAARRRWVGRPSAAVAVVLVTAAAAWLWHSRPGLLPPPSLLPLTALPGAESAPTFSPDGNQIAFQWNGEKRDNWDIYVQIVGSTETRRLTSDPGADILPAWSPDGRQIAYVRPTAGRSALGTVHVVSPLGGAGRRLSELPVAVGPLSWSPDGRWLATGASFDSPTAAMELPRGIRLIRLPDGEARVITSPGGSDFHIQPAFSPEGHRLAYASCRELACWIDVVALNGDLTPTGEPRRLTRRLTIPDGLAWTRDGSSLVYGEQVSQRLWRVGLATNTPPTQVEMAGFAVATPAIAVGAERLAFRRSLSNSDIYRVQAGRPTEVVAASSFDDWNPALSPDGTRFAFASSRGDRGGSADEIWLAAADGSNPTRLTVGPGLSQGSPSWSPDGGRIAFDSMDEEDGRWHIWTIDAAGGSPRRLTSNPGSENHPSWSHDGRFIYFSYGPDSNKTIWRAPATGGSAEQVTRSGGGRSETSPDGKTLYFQRTFVDSALLAVSPEGGAERTVIDCVRRYGFSVTATGVYYVPCARSSALPLMLWDPATRKDQVISSLEGPIGPGLSVSADGKTILFSKNAGQGADLMMIENFR